MTTGHDLERRLTADLHRELDAVVGPHPTWAGSPAAARIAAGRGGIRWPGRLLAVAAVIAVAGGVALLAGLRRDSTGGGLPDTRRLCRGLGPAHARRGDGSRGDLPARSADGDDDDGCPAAGRLGRHRQRRWPGPPDPRAGCPRVRSLAESALVVPGWLAVSRDGRRAGTARRHRVGMDRDAEACSKARSARRSARPARSSGSTYRA